MGIKDRGQQRQQISPAAAPFDFILVDVPVEIVVDVAPKYFSYNWDVRR
jgi:hypothetical protein